MLVVLWFAWCAYTWLAAAVRSESPVVRLVMVMVVAVTAVITLASPPVGDIRLLTPLRAGLWLTAISVDLAGNALTGLRRMRIWSAEHWADRYSLIIIIALGEAVISMGTAVVYTPISARIIVAAGLGTALLAALRWIYFGADASDGERVLAASGTARRTAFARDAYTLLHLPMVAGIVLVSLGLRKTMSVLGQPRPCSNSACRPTNSGISPATARWQRILRPSPPARLAAASAAAVQTGLTALAIASECWRPA